MKPTVVLERVLTPLGEMTLSEHDGDYAIRVASVELMNSRDHTSEDALGREVAGARRALVGGLGLGFTLRAALDVLPAEARVDVVEIVPAVVRWCRDVYGALAGHPLADPRVTVIEDDVAHVIAACRAAYDAILLDVDNGPDGIARANTALYRERGIATAHAALAPGGLLAVWSSFESPTFTRWLRDGGFVVEVERVRARQATHWIWRARKS